MSEKSERDQKTFATYLETIRAKTGKTPDDFRVLAAKKGLEKTAEIVAWLKADFALGHGHANAMAHLLTHADTIKASPEMIIKPPASVRHSNLSLSTIIPRITATTGVTSAMSMVSVTFIFRISQ